MDIREAAKAFVSCHKLDRIDIDYIEANYGSVEDYLRAEGEYGGVDDFFDRYIEVSSHDHIHGHAYLIEWDEAAWAA